MKREFDESTKIHSATELDEMLRKASSPEPAAFANDEHTMIGDSQELAARSMSVPDEKAVLPRASHNVIRRTGPAMVVTPQPEPPSRLDTQSDVDEDDAFAPWDDANQRTSPEAAPPLEEAAPAPAMTALVRDESPPYDVGADLITPSEEPPTVELRPPVLAPMQAAPMQAPPLQAPPLQAPPLQTAPLQAAPMQAAPMQAAPLQAPPMLPPQIVRSAPLPLAPPLLQVAPAPVENTTNRRARTVTIVATAVIAVLVGVMVAGYRHIQSLEDELGATKAALDAANARLSR